VSELSSWCFVPGEIKRTPPRHKTWFGLESFHSSTTGREEEVAHILRHAGKVDLVDDVLAAKFMKARPFNAMTLGHHGDDRRRPRRLPSRTACAS